ncbi:hypothetical protein KM043_013543 [Ampulex compressa]|nr:hypothetical protein KM043_013543 [Ampulex compressa]
MPENGQAKPKVWRPGADYHSHEDGISMSTTSGTPGIADNGESEVVARRGARAKQQDDHFVLGPSKVIFTDSKCHRLSPSFPRKAGLYRVFTISSTENKAAVVLSGVLPYSATFAKPPLEQPIFVSGGGRISSFIRVKASRINSRYSVQIIQRIRSAPEFSRELARSPMSLLIQPTKQAFTTLKRKMLLLEKKGCCPELENLSSKSQKWQNRKMCETAFNTRDLLKSSYASFVHPSILHPTSSWCPSKHGAALALNTRLHPAEYLFRHVRGTARSICQD